MISTYLYIINVLNQIPLKHDLIVEGLTLIAINGQTHEETNDGQTIQINKNTHLYW